MEDAEGTAFRHLEDDGWGYALGVLDEEPFGVFLVNAFSSPLLADARVSFPAARIAYLVYVLSRINARLSSDLGAGVLETVERALRERGGERAVGTAALAMVTLAASRALGTERGDGPRPLSHGTDDEETREACAALMLAVDGLSPGRLAGIFLALEEASRGQSDNVVWHVLRRDGVSATRFYCAYTRGGGVAAAREPRGPPPQSTRFGIDHESVIKAVLAFHVARTEPGPGMGLLIEPGSGLLSASLDACFGVRRCEPTTADAAGGGDWETDSSGRLRLRRRRSLPVSVADGATVYEIKCRHKYLCSPSDERVRNLLRDPSPRSVSEFLLSHPVPGVEYRAPGENPSGREFLVSRDALFKTGKRTRGGAVPEALRRHFPRLIAINEGVASDVIVFDVRRSDGAEGTGSGAPRVDGEQRDDEGGEEEEGCSDAAACSGRSTPELGPGLWLYEKGRISMPVFINPRHPHYFQTLLQHYVLTQYYIRTHSDPERISPSDVPATRVVSAIFRRRAADEADEALFVGGAEVRCEHIPLFVVVTPVRFDPDFVKDAVSTVLNSCERSLRGLTGERLWVPDSARQYAACFDRRETSP